MTTIRLDGPMAPAAQRASRPQLVLRYATIAACLPYLALKVAWISGSSIGDASAEMRSTTYVVGNLITAGLDLVAIALVLAFTCRWGLRIPAWLLLVPMWVGTGLLAPIALGVPLGMVVQLIAGGSAMPAGGDLDGWVFALVYSGFTVQAILLVAAFVLYVRTRWPDLPGRRTGLAAAGPTRPIQRLFAISSATGAIGYGAVHLLWAFSGGGFGGDADGIETAAQQTFWAVQGLLGLVAAIGVLALVQRWGSGWLPLAATWVGAGYVFSSGFFGGSETQLLGFVHLLGAVIGLLMGIAALLLLVEERNPAARRHVTSG